MFLQSTFDRLEQSADRWLAGLDRHLPKKYVTITDALKEAKAELDTEDDQRDSVTRFKGNHTSYLIIRINVVFIEHN